MTATPSQPESGPSARAGPPRAVSALVTQKPTSNWGDGLFKLLCQTAAWLILALALLLVIVVTQHSWLAIRTIGWRFLADSNWDPEPDHQNFGALGFIYGTVVTSAFAMLLAVPLGVATAAFLSEIAPGWLRRLASFLVEMLAAIPSVVYGLWGMFVLAPRVQDLVTWLGGPNTGGRGFLSAGLVLAIMIVPYVTAVSFDVCRAVPSSQRQAALALGATRWETIWCAVLPYARPGIVAASFLALGRAVGETMAVTMLIGNKEEISWSLFSLGDTIASRIANQFTEATYDLFRSALMGLGLLLLLVSTIVNVLARLLIWRVGRTKTGMGAWERLRARIRPEPVSGTATTAPAKLQPLHPWRRHRLNQLMTGVMATCLAATVGPLFLILGYLIFKGVNSLDWAFFTQVHVPVGEPGGGMAHALYGSCMLVGMATLFAVPIGLFAAIYLAEYRTGRLGQLVRFVGELLSGVPSIVVGIFAYQVVVLPMMMATDKEVTFSAWAGSFALGFMMIPIVLRASEEALKLVPRTLRDASMALGGTHWQTVVRITVPAALPAIITAVFLAIARIAGETAPLLLTATDNRSFPSSPSEPTPSVPVLIYKYSISPYSDWHRKAWAAALVLLVVVMLLNFGVRAATGKRQILASRAD
jgi:phosphate transport system permease protein